MKRISHLLIALLTTLVAARAQTSDLAVAFNSPTNGAAFQAPAYLNVTASESSNTIVSAEFFANGQSIGVAYNNILFPGATYSEPPGAIGVTVTTIFVTAHPDSLPDVRPFAFAWNPQPGQYTLTAKATDDHGNTAMSDPVNVTIVPTPAVSVQASVPIATPNGPGIFTVTRNGNTNGNLYVPFFLLGSAQNGIDYTQITNSVTIPAGQFSADIAINPLVYHPGNTRAVSLKIYDYAVPGGGGPGPVPQYIIVNPPFIVGSPDTATVYIKANDRNTHKPIVRITQPNHGQSSPAGSDITITADAMDPDTDVALVEFFDGTTKLGETPAITTVPPRQHVMFDFTWTSAPIGFHVLRARATDRQGKTQVSGPVRIQVLPAP